jgi:hypothetical protein
MKTLQINLAVMSLFIMTSFSASAQTNVTKSTATGDRAEAKKEIKLLNEIPTAKKTVAVETTSANKTQRPTLVSDYMSKEKQIMTWTIAGNIPASIPRHIKGQTKEQYNAILRTWAKNNMNLIKEQYHAKILASPKSIAK